MDHGELGDPGLLKKRSRKRRVPENWAGGGKCSTFKVQGSKFNVTGRFAV
jgi:hypothetical protein